MKNPLQAIGHYFTNDTNPKADDGRDQWQSRTSYVGPNSEHILETHTLTRQLSGIADTRLHGWCGRLRQSTAISFSSF